MKRLELVYERRPQYLSPSSLKELHSRPLRFYLRKCGPYDLRPPDFPQTPPMAVGSAFDAMIKTYLGAPVAEIGRKVDKEHLDEGTIIEETKRIFRDYMSTPATTCYPEGLEPEPTQDEVVTREVGPPHNRITIAGIPDAWGPGVQFDWKVTGAFSQHGGKVPVGYQHLWTAGLGERDDGPHKKAHLNLEEMNKRAEEWATQLTFYAWIKGSTPWPDQGWEPKPFRAIIEVIVVHPEEPLRVARIDSLVSAAHQRRVWDDVQQAWQRIEECNVVPAEMLEGYPDLDALLLTN